MTIKEQLDLIGPPGSNARLQAIANMNLGERSEAAKRVLAKRSERLFYINNGMSIECAKLIVDKTNINQ